MNILTTGHSKFGVHKEEIELNLNKMVEVSICLLLLVVLSWMVLNLLLKTGKFILKVTMLKMLLLEKLLLKKSLLEMNTVLLKMTCLLVLQLIVLNYHYNLLPYNPLLMIQDLPLLLL